jgi:multidrug efflux pump subunit AcrA (membrane-fusion protein)
LTSFGFPVTVRKFSQRRFIVAQSPKLDPIDSSVAAVVALFSGPLEGVSFPEVDRAKLNELVTDVRRAADEVEQARAMLDAASQALDENRRALHARAQRALSYARIYAEGDAAVRESLEGISLSQAQPATLRAELADAGTGPNTPKRRGRPRKGLDANLPFEPPLQANDALAATDTAS